MSEKIDRAPRNGTIINWAIDKVLGVSFISGTVIRPNGDRRLPPHADEVRMQLLWQSYGAFGCHDGVSCFKGHTHVFKQGEPALDPHPYLTAMGHKVF